MNYTERRLHNGVWHITVEGDGWVQFRDFTSTWAKNTYVWWLRVRHGATRTG